jgi:glycosyltransferase involved in cell wall biosynthesis
MRVLITGDTVGGVFTYVCELARALVERDVEAHVALAGMRLTPEQRSALRASGASRLYAQEAALEWMPDPWADVERVGDRLQEVAADVRPDVVHLNEFAHGALPWPAPVLLVAHSDVTTWHRAVRGAEAGPEWDEYRRRVAAGLAGADLVVAPTAALLRELERSYPLRATAVIPNGRAASGIVRPKEPFVLGAGRRWDEAKNLAALERLELPVVVAGGDVARDELDELYARATVFASPARYEPFGLAILEAALAGCALVLGDLPSLRETWGDDALYVDPDDDEALAAAIRSALADPRPALERARRLTPARMAEAYLASYARLPVAAR